MQQVNAVAGIAFESRCSPCALIHLLLLAVAAFVAIQFLAIG